MRYALKVAYDGTSFCGWQVQGSKRTVQQELNCAVKKAFAEDVQVTASGRTDSGVHALSQVCHVDLSRDITGAKLADALNYYLPQDVSVLCAAPAPQDFDANRSAKKKTYLYKMYISRRNPLSDRFSTRLDRDFDVEKMLECAALFVGEHDFAAYCASGSQVKTTVRTVYSFDIKREGEQVFCYVCGNGFLYNMVRTLVGTALWYAYGKITLEKVLLSLESGDRALVGKTMPAKGLTLLSVDYSYPLFK